MTKSITVRLLLAFTIALSVSACDSLTSTSPQKPISPAADATNDINGAVVAVVNGRPIPKTMFEIYIKQRTQNQPLNGASDEMTNILNEFIDMELMFQDAQKRGIGRRPEIAGMLGLQIRNVLVRTRLQEYSTNNPISEEALKTAYEQQSASQSPKEYKARHILSKTEEEALELITQLDNGADFAQLAKDHSTGPSSTQGGDLGWFPPDRMVEAFSNAAMALEKGTYTKEPVETQFGWHVILLEDARETTPPTFDQSKHQIKMTLQRQQLEDYIGSLRDSAQIDIKYEPGVEPAAESEAEGS